MGLSAAGEVWYLVGKDAEPRANLEAARQATQGFESDLNRLILDHTTGQTQLEGAAQESGVSVGMLERQKGVQAAKQRVRADVAGTVEEIWLEDATNQGITATLVIVSRGK